MITACIALTACDDAEKKGLEAIGTIKDYGAQAPAAIEDAKEQVDEAVTTGKSMIESINGMIEDAKKRMNQVQSGVNLMMQGKEMIEEGVQGNEEM